MRRGTQARSATTTASANRHASSAAWHPAATAREDAAVGRAALTRDAEAACSLLAPHIQASTDRLRTLAAPCSAI